MNELIPLEQLERIADKLANSNVIPAAYKRKPFDLFAVAMKGRELGIGVWEALSSIHAINGVMTASARLMLGLVYKKLPNARLKFIESPDRCEVLARRSPDDEWQKFCFTLDDAKKMGLLDKANWKKMPKAMLRARATSVACGAMFPDCVIGMYTPEEIDPNVSVDTEGEVIKPTEFKVVFDKERAVAFLSRYNPDVPNLISKYSEEEIESLLGDPAFKAQLGEMVKANGSTDSISAFIGGYLQQVKENESGCFTEEGVGAAVDGSPQDANSNVADPIGPS